MGSLTACLGKAKVSAEDIAEIRQAIREAGGDEVAGFNAYLAGLQNDAADLRTQLEKAGFYFELKKWNGGAEARALAAPEAAAPEPAPVAEPEAVASAPVEPPAPEPVAPEPAPVEAAAPEPEQPAAPAEPPPPAAPPAYGSTNTLVTSDRAAELRAKLKARLGASQLNAGIDPMLMVEGAELAVYHIEAGARSFASFVRAMVADLGRGAQPYLRMWYNAARDFPGMDASGMTPYDVVAGTDLDALVAMAAEAPSPATTPAAAEPAEAPAADPEVAEPTPEQPRVDSQKTPAQRLVEVGLFLSEKTSKKGKTYWAVTGELAANKEALDRAGFGDPWQMDRKTWRSYHKGDPTQLLLDALTGEGAPATPAEPPAPPAEATADDRQALVKAGLVLGRTADGKHLITGNTFDAKDIIKAAGGRWNRASGGWEFTDDPTVAIAAALAARDQGAGADGDAAGDADAAARDAERTRLEQLRQREDARADERAVGLDIDGLVAADTQALIRKGLQYGIPQEVVDDQVEDVALIAAAHKNGKPLFLLANEAGTGKTFVLGAAIRELRRQGQSRFVYVTMNQDLIEQIKRDLEPYGIGDVRFMTYSELSGAGADNAIEAARDAVLIFDESHNVKNIAAGTARADTGQSMANGARFTIFSSATPFENPVQARYLSATGIFDQVGGFASWAKAYGASVKRRKFYNPNTRRKEVEEIIYWAGGKAKRKDSAAARQWMFRQGVMTQRSMRLDPSMVDVNFIKEDIDQRYVDIYEAVDAAYGRALNEAWSEIDDGGFGEAIDPKLRAEISRHRENTIKRILEASKVGFAIQRARGHLARGRSVVMFVETKADRELGRFRKSQHFKDDTLYDYPEMVSLMVEWQQEAGAAQAIARVTGERANIPPRPFADFVLRIAKAFHEAGISYELPSTAEQITEALGGRDKVAQYHGGVSDGVARKDKAAFLAGQKKVIVATMAKGGTGLSLHDTKGDRPTTQVNINLPWVAQQVDQVSGRVARYGLQSKAEIEWLFTGNIPWESSMLAPRVAGRMADMGAVVKGISTRAADALADFDFSGVIDVKGSSAIDTAAVEASDDGPYGQAMRDEQSRGQPMDTRNGFFETPYPLSMLMRRLSGVVGGERVLEPSAGHGALLRYLPPGANVTAVEQRTDNAAVLRLKGGLRLFNEDFVGWSKEHAAERFDAILMNPPFERIAEVGAQDVAHIQQAYKHLAPGGRLVAILGEGAFFRSYKQETAFRQWLDDVGATVIRLPEGAFRASGTMVRARMVVIDRGAAPGRSDLNLGDLDAASLQAVEDEIVPRGTLNAATPGLVDAARVEEAAALGIEEPLPVEPEPPAPEPIVAPPADVLEEPLPEPGSEPLIAEADEVAPAEDEADGADDATPAEPGLPGLGGGTAGPRTRKPRATRESDIIQDAGEKIGGARKDLWASRSMELSDLDGMTPAEEFSFVTKDAAWKAPDYAQLVADGMDPRAAALLKILRDNLGAKPMDDAQARRDYLQMMGLIRDAVPSLKTPEDVVRLGRRLQDQLGVSRDRYYGQGGEEQKTARRIYFSVARQRKGQRVTTDPLYLDSSDADKAADMVRGGFPGEMAPWTKEWTILRPIPYLQRQQTYGIGETRSHRLIANGFATEEEAVKVAGELWAKMHPETAGGSGGTTGPTVPARPHLDFVRRTGEDKRGGRDVDSPDFIADFGFRGVEFGNWVAGDERQKVVNLAYDALHDLAQVLGVPPQVISLDGSLALAFGARGSGGAAAHYESGRLVINMTKIKGAGSLAHEWAHALDHYFGELDRDRGGKGEPTGASGWYDRTAQRTSYLKNLRPEMAQAFNDLMQALWKTKNTKAMRVRALELRLEKQQEENAQAEDIAKRAEEVAAQAATPAERSLYTRDANKQRAWLAITGKPALDKIKGLLAKARELPEDADLGMVDSSFLQEARKLSGKSGDKGYWTRPTEMFARSFEAWVFDRIAARGNVSQYLVQGVEDSRYATGFKGDPYPAKAEREAINKAYDRLVATMQVRPGKSGKPALYSLRRGGKRGLDMSKEARLARARAMGFDTSRVLYHGTSAVDDFPAFKRKPNDIGIHLGTSGQANDRLDYLMDAGKRSADLPHRTIPVYAKIRKPLRLPDLGFWGSENLHYQLRQMPEFDQETVRRAAVSAGNEAGRVKALQNLIKSKGYDSIVYRNDGEVEGARELRNAARAALKVAMEAVGGRGSISPEQQQHPAYVAYEEAQAKSDAFVKANAQDSYIVFDPEQIRSVHAAFDPDDASSGDILYSLPRFHSALHRAVTAYPTKAALPAKQWVGILRNMKGIKPAELQWSGVIPWLEVAPDEKVTRDEIALYIKSSEPRISEATLGGRPPKSVIDDIEGWLQVNAEALDIDPEEWIAPLDAAEAGESFGIEWLESQGVPGHLMQPLYDSLNGGSVKYSSYTIPGAENYREVLLQLPVEAWEPPPVQWQRAAPVNDPITVAYYAEPAGRVSIEEMTNGKFVLRSPGGTRDLFDSLDEAKAAGERVINNIDPSRQQNPSAYRSSHWVGHENVLAHLRLSDRVDAGGRRTLFVEEVQSDWHREGRQRGYQGQLSKNIKIEQRNGRWAAVDADLGDVIVYAATAAEAERIAKLSPQNIAADMVPDAPFKEEWAELSMKTAIRMAVEGGYDAVAWAPGQVHKDRYDLSKQVKSVNYFKRPDGRYIVYVLGSNGRRRVWEEDDATLDSIEKALGKDIAAKIGADEAVPGEYQGYRKIEGDGLRMGGEWADALYDRAIPRFLDKFTKPMGGKVEKTEMQTGAPEFDINGDRPWAIIDPDGNVAGVAETQHEADELFLDMVPPPERNDGWQVVRKSTSTASVWTLPLTDGIREAARQGLPLWARGGQQTGPQFRLTQDAAARLPAIEADLRERLKALGIADRIALAVRKQFEDFTGFTYDDFTGAAPDGQYLNGMIEIALEADDTRWILNHEVIHALRDLGVLRPAEWAALEKAARADAERLAEIRERYRDRGLDEELLLEETIADMYADWARERLQAGGFLKTAFTRIREFFRGLGQALRGQGFTTPEMVFDRIERGAVGRRRTADDVEMEGEPAFALPRLKRGVDRLVADAQSMASWRDWYDRHQAVLNDLFDGDADLFQSLLSATSQMASVKANVGLALKAYGQLKRGEPFTGYLPAVIKNLERVRAAEAVRGPKISAYADANTGTKAAVAVDRHISQLFFGTQTPTGAMIIKARQAINAVARRLGWEPREVQAALWAFNQVRTGTNPADVQSYDTVLLGKRDAIRALRSAFADTGGAGEGLRERGDAAAGVGEGDPAEWVRAALEEALKANPDLDYGLRVLPEDTPDVVKGDALWPSSRWEDGEPVGDPLPGTSTIGLKDAKPETIRGALGLLGAVEGAARFYDGSRVVLVAGRKVGDGTDAGETLLRDAKAVAMWEKADYDAGPIVRPRFALRRGARQGSLLNYDLPGTLQEMRADNHRWLSRAFGRRASATVAAHIDLARHRFQDRFIQVRRLQEAAERWLGRPLTEAENAYLAEEGFASKVGERKFRVDTDFRLPIAQAMKEAGLTLDEVDSYLLARHARERNEQIARINPRMPDGGSGMTTADAQRILDDVRIGEDSRRAALERIGQLVDGMMTQRLDWMVESGLLSPDAARVMRETYQNYVPLRGIEEETDPEAADAMRPTVGVGFMGNRRVERRAFGRTTVAPDILATAFTLSDEAIVRGEKNMVAQALLNLVRQVPDPQVWEVNPSEMRAYIANEAYEELDPATGQRVQRTRQVVRYKPQPHYSPKDTVSVRVGGREFRIRIHDPLLLREIERMGGVELSAILARLGSFTQLLSRANTGWNPEFLVTNAIRDIQTALINIGKDTDAAGIRREILKGWGPAVVGYHHYIATGRDDTAWSALARDFRENGGATAYNQITDVESEARKLEQLMATFNHGTAADIWRRIKSVGDWIENKNNAVDAGVRLATYKALIDAGAPKSKAASVAKNLTVNFNRRGEYGSALNALYMFFNASTQGTAVMLSAMKHRKVQVAVASIVVAGAMQELLNGLWPPDDDDEDGLGLTAYERVPEFVKQRSLVFMYGPKAGQYFTFPMPLGYNFFHNVGRLIAAQMRGAREADGRPVSTAQTIAKAATAFAGAMVPTGFTDYLVPTIAEPMVDVLRNEDYFGSPIMPTRMPGDTTPDSQLYYPSVSAPSKAVAQVLNQISGGDEFRPGMVDVSPESIDHVVSTFAGAAGSSIMKLINVGERAAGEVMGTNAEDPQFGIRDLPFVRKIVGYQGFGEQRDVTYTRMSEIEILADEAKRLADPKLGDAERLREFKARNQPLLNLKTKASTLRQALAASRKRRLALINAEGEPTAERRAQLDELATKDRERMRDFNRDYMAAMAKVLEASE